MGVVGDHHNAGKFEALDPLVGALGAAVFDVGEVTPDLRKW
jgi:hypothetical protein